MRREGSPWTGLWTIVAKETADHLTSSRIWFLEGLILLAAGGAVYAAIGQIRATVSQDPFLFLSLFTVAKEPLPSFVAFLGFLVPLVAIALGFDSINTEHTRRTMSRILAQPIYRDALLMGKFLAGLLTL
ncbi:MAG: ABC transporter permease, partial [Rhodospirillales bacterium]